MKQPPSPHAFAMKGSQTTFPADTTHDARLLRRLMRMSEKQALDPNGFIGRARGPAGAGLEGLFSGDDCPRFESGGIRNAGPLYTLIPRTVTGTLSRPGRPRRPRQ